MNNDIEFIKTSKFKKNIIKINFRRPIKKEEITKINLLLSILLITSKKYKTNRELVLETKKLYDLMPESIARISGNCIIMSFSFTFLMDKYTEENNTLKAIDFIKEIIFNPDVVDESFASASFKMAKQEIYDDIKTFKENKIAYSRIRMFEKMDSSSPYSINYAGYLDELEKINEKNLYEFYQEVINNSKVDIFALGDIKKEYFDNWKINSQNIKLSHRCKLASIKNVQTISEPSDTSQSKLVMGYNMNKITKEEAKSSLEIYIHILGAGPDSKLFTNVREKASLCYNISAMAKYIGSFVMIEAGIDASKFKKAVLIINEQVSDMANGKFTDNDVANAIINIKTTYKELAENPHTIIALRESQKYFKSGSLKRRLALLDEVTKEQVVEVAKKIKLNTIFLLEGKKK